MQKEGFLPTIPELTDEPGRNYYFNSLTNIWEYTTPEYAPV
jgi:hypothetical protein